MIDGPQRVDHLNKAAFHVEHSGAPEHVAFYLHRHAIEHPERPDGITMADY